MQHPLGVQATGGWALLYPKRLVCLSENEQACLVCAQPPAAAGGGGQAGPLDFLRSNPQFQALRSIVQSHPAILQPMLQARGPRSARAVHAHCGVFPGLCLCLGRGRTWHAAPADCQEAVLRTKVAVAWGVLQVLLQERSAASYAAT